MSQLPIPDRLRRLLLLCQDGDTLVLNQTEAIDASGDNIVEMRELLEGKTVDMKIWNVEEGYIVRNNQIIKPKEEK